MITKLYVDNYKTLVDFTVEFQPLTLIVGANGSGKTAITEVLNAVSLMLRGKLELNKAFPRETLSKFTDGNLVQTFRIFVTLGDNEYKYTFSVEQNSLRDAAKIQYEMLEINGESRLFFEDSSVAVYDISEVGENAIFNAKDNNLSLFQISIIPLGPSIEDFMNFFVKKIFNYQINPFSIYGYSKEESDFLSRNGENFSAWYRHNQAENPLALDKLYTEIAGFMPGFKYFRLSGSEGRRSIMCEFSEGKFPIDFDFLSEGQKSLIVLCAILVFGETKIKTSQTLIFDEPENFISLKEIQPWLRKVEDWIEEGNGQIILISHHPETMNYEGDDAIVWLERENGQQTRLKSREEIAAGHGLLFSDRFSRES